MQDVSKKDGGPRPAEADVAAAVSDELGQIQRILVGGLAERTDTRIAELEATLSRRLDAIEARTAERLDALDARIDAAVAREELADALEAVARGLRTAAPARRPK